MQSATINHDPNFPDGLSIKPSERLTGYIDLTFDQQEAIAKFGIAGRIWEAAYVLEEYILAAPGFEYDPPFCSSSPGVPRNPRTILELGSGTGATAHVLATTLGESDIVIATDLPSVCPLLDLNLHEDVNKHPGHLHVRPLEWGNVEHVRTIEHEFNTCGDERKLRDKARGITDVVCSDLVYFPELLPPLLRTLILLTSPGRRHHNDHELVTVTISYKIRSLAKETPFWTAFGLWFEFQPVLYRERKSPSSTWHRLGSQNPDGPVFVFIARRRLSSFDWEEELDMMSDEDLMRGAVGGVTGGRGDDTFERMLMMMMLEETDMDAGNLGG